MHDPRREALRWLDQAENDLGFAQYALAGGFFHQVCFVSQQCAEKALKAVHYLDGARTVLGHSRVGLLARLTEAHPRMTELNDHAAELDLFYVSSRYPNGLVEGVPHGVITKTQAERALAAARALLAAAEAEPSVSTSAGSARGQSARYSFKRW